MARRPLDPQIPTVDQILRRLRRDRLLAALTNSLFSCGLVACAPIAVRLDPIDAEYEYILTCND
jgi:hypothetical protein